MHPPFEWCGGTIDFCNNVSPLAALCIVFRDNASRERLGTKSFDVPVDVIDFLPPVGSPAALLSCIFDARQMVTTISTWQAAMIQAGIMNTVNAIATM